jgi:hypothetical protein
MEYGTVCDTADGDRTDGRTDGRTDREWRDREAVASPSATAVTEQGTVTVAFGTDGDRCRASRRFASPATDV